MDILVALLVLILVVWFTKSIFWAIVYILIAMLLVALYRRYVANR